MSLTCRALDFRRAAGTRRTPAHEYRAISNAFRSFAAAVRATIAQTLFYATCNREQGAGEWKMITGEDQRIRRHW